MTGTVKSAIARADTVNHRTTGRRQAPQVHKRIANIAANEERPSDCAASTRDMLLRTLLMIAPRLKNARKAPAIVAQKLTNAAAISVRRAGIMTVTNSAAASTAPLTTDSQWPGDGKTKSHTHQIVATIVNVVISNRKSGGLPSATSSPLCVTGGAINSRHPCSAPAPAA